METSQYPESTPAPEQTRTTPNVWGPWATLGLTLLALLAASILGGILALILYAVMGGDLGKIFRSDMDALASDGLFMTVGIFAQTIVFLACVPGLVWLRRATLRDYLGLHFPSVRATAQWILIFMVFLAAQDIVTVFVLGRPIVPSVMVDAYRAAPSLLLLFVAIVILAPLGEELLMRGFLFKGIASKWGGFAAVTISAVLWAVLHLQYDLYGVFQILLIGLFLGLARLRTGSTTLAFVLHALCNLVASIETAIVAGSVAP